MRYRLSVTRACAVAMLASLAAATPACSPYHLAQSEMDRMAVEAEKQRVAQQAEDKRLAAIREAQRVRQDQIDRDEKARRDELNRQSALRAREMEAERARAAAATAAKSGATNGSTSNTVKPSAADCSAPDTFKATLMNEPYCMRHGIAGFDVPGTYATEGSRVAYRTILNPDGTGSWENEGGLGQQGNTNHFLWGIRVAMDGTPMRETGQYGERHTIFLVPTWTNPDVRSSNIYMIEISYDQKYIVIARERYKRF